MNKQLKELSGVGPATITNLHALGIFSIEDLCFHLPYSYQNRSKIISISHLVEGEEFVVMGKVVSVQTIYRPRKMMVVRINDGSGFLNLRFFYFHPNQAREFKKDRDVVCFGKVSISKYGYELIHPEYSFESNNILEKDFLIPLYRVTKGISQKKIRAIIQNAIKNYDFSDTGHELKKYDSAFELDLKSALLTIHLPLINESLQELLPGGSHPARVRLMKEEMVAFQCGMIVIKEKKFRQNAFECTNESDWTNDIFKNLKFELTNAQHRVISEIYQDLAKNIPMLRLVQGDVGSGKTMIALLSCCRAIDSNTQAVIMAPTTILAEQHFLSILDLLKDKAEQIALLTSSTPSKERKKITERLVSGEIKLLIGTHAVFQIDIVFKKLGMVVIDEQHRFGVNQRLSLVKKENERDRAPHQLTLTATPIPRTLAMSIYAHMDVSVVDELPPGRSPIITTLLAKQKISDLSLKVTNAIKNGSKIYWVCPLIEESETLDLSNVEEREKELSEFIPKPLIAKLHGRMKPLEKMAVMESFKAGKIKVLVSTTVIEVGVDVKDADIMIIENAERFGL
ncbi:MAG: ATP-dependent DNA helicase RecG, partial [Gammaproteobacteria bacterium]